MLMAAIVLATDGGITNDIFKTTFLVEQKH
ncbi:hypothetical protein SAMN05192529_12312 [Arachidicoccus rhizosphaerae]|uniref:Uncharacterized protein n=1 Tax=Arachidicoccus rhizosphaerae TaxID=551991 RepID=A0A1H4BNB7_9BACT|nr:hypothetical protein SAMN05192529_12312 [Arachidicoccus rhizosphaerae]